MTMADKTPTPPVEDPPVVAPPVEQPKAGYNQETGEFIAEAAD